MPDMSVVAPDVLFCLFKGEPGLRKSSAALSFPKPIYFFDFDNKMEGLHAPMLAWNINPRDVRFDTYTDWDKARVKLERFRVNVEGNKTIVVDSVTSCADAINRQTLKFKGGNSAGKSIGTIQVNSIEDFNAEDSALKELVALLKEIKSTHKVNVILVAHVIQKEIKTSDGKTHMSRVIVTAGKGIAQKIPAYCTEAYHFNIKSNKFDPSAGGQYALLTTHTGDDFARTSLPLDEEIVFGNDPLYDKWIRPAIDVMKMKLNPASTKPNENETTTTKNKFSV